MHAPEPAPRLGWLKNGNRPGRFSDAKRCGAGSKRSGEPCRAPACRGKRRCRFHGGKSTGPRTAEGLERSRRARRKHGAYSVETRQDLERLRAEIRVFLARGAALRERILGDMAALIRQLQRQRRNRRRRVRSEARCLWPCRRWSAATQSRSMCSAFQTISAKSPANTQSSSRSASASNAHSLASSCAAR